MGLDADDECACQKEEEEIGNSNARPRMVISRVEVMEQ